MVTLRRFHSGGSRSSYFPFLHGEHFMTLSDITRRMIGGLGPAGAPLQSRQARL
jgi:hypothetical protein